MSSPPPTTNQDDYATAMAYLLPWLFGPFAEPLSAPTLTSFAWTTYLPIPKALDALRKYKPAIDTKTPWNDPAAQASYDYARQHLALRIRAFAQRPEPLGDEDVAGLDTSNRREGEMPEVRYDTPPPPPPPPSPQDSDTASQWKGKGKMPEVRKYTPPPTPPQPQDTDTSSQWKGKGKMPETREDTPPPTPPPRDSDTSSRWKGKGKMPESREDTPPQQQAGSDSSDPSGTGTKDTTPEPQILQQQGDGQRTLAEKQRAYLERQDEQQRRHDEWEGSRPEQEWRYRQRLMGMRMSKQCLDEIEAQVKEIPRAAGAGDSVGCEEAKWKGAYAQGFFEQMKEAGMFPKKKR
ncbi:MAG: hypothetical protein Q9219_005398 [cf. Caloplaca sp. 3 TL-2023]